MNKCKGCNISKESICFHKKGGTRLDSYCKICRSNIQKTNYNDTVRDKKLEHKLNNRAKYNIEFQLFLDGKKCVDCGNTDKRVFEFDHLGGKKFNISAKRRDMPLSTLMEEINKCEIVCANCHRIRTISRLNSK